ncbi:MAG: PQQ-dependent sugar dehydrogenase [Mobilitalea sp.]
MHYKPKGRTRVNIYSLTENDAERYLNPSDINLPPGYNIEVFAQGLNTPTSILFTINGDMMIADSGYVSGNPAILRLSNGVFDIIADNFKVPLIGINYLDGDIYASHKGTITVIKRDGTRIDIINGLPSDGDYSNSKVGFGLDGKMYFGQGTATNSGVVGIDNSWVFNHPFFHDYAGSYVLLNGQNFETRNIMIPDSDEITHTGAFSPYGEPNLPFETRKSVTKASGSILKANLDGSELELVAWGLRSLAYVKFDEGNRLFASNNGFDIRGSRPIANAPDEFQLIIPGKWYGWPDYCGGEPVTSSRFKPEGGKQPEFLLTNHPGIPPKPFAIFPPNATIIGFDFNYNSAFGPYGDAYIAEFGSVRPTPIEDIAPLFAGTGHRISKIEINTGGVTTFAINKSGFPSYITGEGGFGRLADIAFGPDGAMYVVDMGISPMDEPNIFLPNTGVIWRITKTV